MNIKIDKSDWVKVRLGDVAFEYSKRINNPSESEYDKFVGSNNIGQWDFRVKSWESTDTVTSAMKLFEPNDYLLVRRSLYASDFRERAPRANFHGVCSGDILTIKENPKYIHNGFLIGILNSPKLWKYVVANGSGSITRRIHWDDLADYEFFLPPVKQQKLIAELLWSADEIIEKELNLLSNCEILFNIQEKELLNHEDYIEEDILEVASVQRGRFSHRPRNAPQFYGGEIPFIQTAEVVEADKYIKKYSQTLNESGLKISKLFKKDTIVMTIAANIGYVGMLSFDCAFTDSLVGINAVEEKINQEYLFYYLNNKQREIESLSTESAQKNLSIERFTSFKVKYPKCQDKQKEIVKQLDEILNLRALIQAKTTNTKSLKMSLIQQIF